MSCETDSIQTEFQVAHDPDYDCALTVSHDKFTIIAFGYDREHCEETLNWIFTGKYKFTDDDITFDVL